MSAIIKYDYSVVENLLRLASLFFKRRHLSNEGFINELKNEKVQDNKPPFLMFSIDDVVLDDLFIGDTTESSKFQLALK